MPTVKSILLFFVCGIAVLFSQRAEAALECYIGDPWNTPIMNFGITNAWSMQRQHRVRRHQNMTVECYDDAQYVGDNVNVCLYIGDGSAGNGNQYKPRVLKKRNQNQYIHFQIYKDSGYSNAWGTFSNGPPEFTPHLVFLALQPSSWGGWGESEGSANFTIYAETLRQRVDVGTTSYYWGTNGRYVSNFTGNHTELRAKRGNPVTQCPSTPAEANAQGWFKGTFPFRTMARIRKQCEITSSTIADLNFGTVAGLSGTSPESSTTLNVQCTKNTPYRIGLGNGRYASGTQRRMRHMTSTTNHISYDLYKDANHSQPWGNDFGSDTIVDGGNTKNGTGTGLAQTHTIFGKVPTPQTPVGGDYKDTVTITVRY